MPCDAEVVAALRVIAAALGIGARAAADTFTQDALPPDCSSRDVFLRRHRARTKARTPGWTKRGKTRAVTAEAWRADVEQETGATRARTPKLALVPAQRDVSAELDRALGIRTRAAK
jgi:hypothetical protein